jgi:hypothetical protein
MEQIIFETWVHMDWIQPTRFWKRENKIVLSWEKCEFELGSNKKEIRRKKQKKNEKRQRKGNPNAKKNWRENTSYFYLEMGVLWAIQ